MKRNKGEGAVTPAASGGILEDILRDPSRIAALPKESIPSLRGELARLDSMLLVRLLAPQISNTDDQLLDATEAAEKIGTSEDWLYRHAKSLPFTVRVGKKCLRFSKLGMDRYIRQRAG